MALTCAPVSYIEERNGGYYVVGSKIGLDAIVYSYRRGESPEYIQQGYPVLSLEKVHRAIAYYLANREAVDAYVVEEERLFDLAAEESRRRNPELHARLDAARQKMRAAPISS
jgi:uncharacterized protein (DUF433 family)